MYYDIAIFPGDVSAYRLIFIATFANAISHFYWHDSQTHYRTTASIIINNSSNAINL